MVYYFIGNNTNWQATSSWATYSGGPSYLTGSSVTTTSNDTAIFDANSGNCNYNQNATIGTLDFTNYSKTFSFTAMPNYLIVNNSLNLGANMNLRYVTSGSVTYSFSNTLTTSGGFFILPIATTNSTTNTTASVKTNGKYLNGIISFGYRYSISTSPSYYQINNLSVNLLDTLNTDLIELWGISNNGGSSHPMYASGTLSFTGSYGFNTKSLLCLDNFGTPTLNLVQSGNYILNSGVTYSITTNLIINAIISSYTNVLVSSSIANQPAYLNVTNGATVSISQTDFRDIDCSGGKLVRIYDGNLTRTTNITTFNYTDVQPFVSGFAL